MIFYSHEQPRQTVSPLYTLQPFVLVMLHWRLYNMNDKGHTYTYSPTDRLIFAECYTPVHK